MTDTSNLVTKATLIAMSSPRIRDFALDAAANIVAQGVRAADQEARIAALEARVYAQSASNPVSVPGPPETPVPVKGVLFEDDFAGTTLNLAKWDVKNRGIFVPANVSVNNGLTIQAVRGATGAWTSGEIQGLAPASQYVGPHYAQSRSKFPGGAGSFPAPFWERDAPWGALGIENDVCEQLGFEPTRYHVTVHNGPNESFGKVIETGVDLSLDYHTYGCAMYDNHADYYFDGKWMASITFAESKLTAWKFTTTPLVALIDLDMGGWGGAVDPGLSLLKMSTSSIRVWAI